MLPAEYSEKAASTAMRRMGWVETDGKDLCGLCQQMLEETGKLPDRRIWKGETDK